MGEKPDTYAWQPFGGGTRRCLGGAFAMLELRTILCTIVREARFRASDEPVEGFARSNIILYPKEGGLVMLDRRPA